MKNGDELKLILIVFILIGTLCAETIDCTKVFEERKLEILMEVEKIDAATQSFEALKAATNSLFDKQQLKLDEQKADVNASMRAIVAKEASIKKMLEENQKLLDAINGVKNTKLSETYTKMKDSAAAGILELLPLDEASAVIFSLSATKVSKIMAKMTPDIASKITQRLRRGPPFDKVEKSSVSGN